MTNPDFLFGLTPGDIVYDEETFPNVFTVGFLHRKTRQKWQFEISKRRNDIQQLCSFVDAMRGQGCRAVGFNNLGFDYPVLHYIYQNRNAGVSASDIYTKAKAVIGSHGPAKFAHMVWESDWKVDQVDLYKIHHFDNVSKATGLKVLEFNMRMLSIEDLPFPVGTALSSDQIDTLIEYMWHDIEATDMFAERTKSQIELREALSVKFSKNMMNMSDIKIGETILVTEMEKKGIKCYEYVGGKKIKKQTRRESIDLSQVVFPYIRFDNPQFQQVVAYLKSKIITETKGVFKGLKVELGGITYHFGTGGLHASVDSQIVRSDQYNQLIDVDVSSYYPKTGIENRLYPAHLGEEFCDVYERIYQTRLSYKKGTPENGAFKLALVGAYGGSNNEYSPLFDPFYTMSITINGQLLLCMLIEQLIKTPGLKMIQANTDGVTYLCPNEWVDHTRNICKWWEDVTRLELEEVFYSRMFIRDVNNYIAERDDGSLKRIGVYSHVTAEEDVGTRELPHHKDWSSRVVALAAEAALVRGTDIREFITHHDDVFDFFLRTKVPKSSTLEWGEKKVSNIVRYYICDQGSGARLEKVMSPSGVPGSYKRANKLTDEFYNSVINELIQKETAGYTPENSPSYDDMMGNLPWDSRINTKNKSRNEERRVGINTGWNVQICNNLNERDLPLIRASINHEWYIIETEKIVNPLLQASGLDKTKE